MDEGLDTGDILLKKSCRFCLTRPAAYSTIALLRSPPLPLLEALDQLERGTAPRVPQDAAQATYAPKLTRDQGRIDWNEPAQLIERKIRAYDPWPGAFTRLRDPAGVRAQPENLSRDGCK
jgi:methionyl-tRNA formyltransferase